MSSLFASRGFIAEGTTMYLELKTQTTQAVSDLKVSFLWSSFPSSRKYYTNRPRRPQHLCRRAWPDEYKGVISGAHVWVAANSCLVRLQAHSKRGKSCLELET